MKNLIPILLVIVLISGCVAQTNPYQLEFGGRMVNFRGNLNEAEKVSVSPDKLSIINSIISENLTTINITFIPNDGENGFFAVSAFELSYKLTMIRNYYGLSYQLNSSILTSKEDIVPMEGTIHILLLGPSQTNETYVEVDNNIITIAGASFEEEGRKYTDLDLAADKFLMILMK